MPTNTRNLELLDVFWAVKYTGRWIYNHKSQTQ